MRQYIYILSILIITMHPVHCMDNIPANITDPMDRVEEIVAPVVGAVIAVGIVIGIWVGYFMKSKNTHMQQPPSVDKTVQQYGHSNGDAQQAVPPAQNLTSSILPMETVDDDTSSGSSNPPSNEGMFHVVEQRHKK